MTIGTFLSSALLYCALRSSSRSRSPRSRSAKCRTVVSSPPNSFHRWLPSTMVMVPIASSQSWNGMNAVSIFADVQVAQ